jgi:hypothetical protein
MRCVTTTAISPATGGARREPATACMVPDLFYYAQLLLEGAVGMLGIRTYEEPPFTVVDELPGGIEVRRYEPRLGAEVTMSGSADRAGRNQAFSVLFAYIAGANRADDGPEKIAMTVPVETTRRGEEIAMAVATDTEVGATAVRMRFFLPSRYTFETAPRPSDPRVRLVEVPPETIAVLRYSGSPDEREIAERGEAMLRALADSRWRAASAPTSLFYDAPFTPPFLRRNEAAVTVEPR